MKIPYRVIGENLLSTKKALQTAITHMKRNQEPFALVVKRDTFLPCRLKDSDAPLYPAREDVIRLIMKSLSSDTLLISTTGTISRETWEVKNELGGNQNAVFLSVGGMGHASQIALGAALKKPDRRVVCLDGDGAMLMHMGSLAINGTRKLPNFFHIVLNNGSHDSVGGQPTVGWDIEFCGIARAVGYEVVLKADSIAGVIQSLETLRKCKGPSFFEVRVGKGHRRSLPRPTKGLARIKESFIKCTADSNGTTEL
jgi:phosphonopyruvate decarboxylase